MNSAIKIAAVALLTIAGLTACNGGSDGAVMGGGRGPTVGASSLPWKDYDRAVEYPGTVTTAQTITMRDGVRLAVSVALPADASGQAVTGRVPAILTQTGYNKGIPVIPAYNAYFVTHGYAHVSVDVRGTGNSEGEWEAFSAEEQKDYLETIDWVSKQPWCNGKIGTWGASFMGITQMFTAAWQHPSHKAMFAIVPMGDAYRDIVFSGGQVNVGFIPLWMGLVTVLSVIPPSTGSTDPADYTLLLEHLVNALVGFQVPTIVDAVDGGPSTYDSPFWRTRSPLEFTDRIKTPTFIVGGLNDLFQRGEPLLYEALKGHTTAKLLLGPWQHLGGSMGEGLPRDGVPSIDHIALMWFDRYLRNVDNDAERMPNVTQYLYGEERYVTSTDWPHPQASAKRMYLRGNRSLSADKPAEGEGSNLLVQQPVNGICSTSTSQWTAGIIGLLPLPCSSNNITELLEVTYTTPPMEKDFYFNGPIQADLWISSLMPDASLVARITDVAPNGTSRELTNGILTASMRAVDNDKSRFLDGQMIQPWHPFTEASRAVPGSNQIVKLPIEVFPTSAVIKQGHSLRISVGASDFPHGAPPVPDLLDQAVGLITIYSDADHPSSVVLPTVPLSTIH